MPLDPSGAGGVSGPGFGARIDAAFAALGIAPGAVAARGLPLCAEAGELVVAEVDAEGREHRLAPAAAAAWHALKAAAAEDGLLLEIVSAFRSFERQVEIIERKLCEGSAIGEILSVVAPPGFSEHHTGCAVDVNTPGCEAWEEEFENTAAFDWMRHHAGRWSFSLSYPRGNPWGYVYEPWHWCFRPPQATA